MLTEEKIREIITNTYAARVRNDKVTLGKLWAEGATFRLAGNPPIPGVSVPAPASVINDVLVDVFTMEAWEPQEFFIDGNRAAVRCNIRVSAKGKPAVASETMDLWRFNDEGKVIELLQFVDTALARDLLS